MIADVAFHHMDKTNPHAHIMLTTRAVGPAGFGGKVRDWNDRTHAETWRASWADHANRALANAGYQEEIDHRSYERQGLENAQYSPRKVCLCDGNTRYRNRTRRTESSD